MTLKTEVMMMKIQLCITGKKLPFKIYSNRNVILIMLVCNNHYMSVLQQTNAALIEQKRFLLNANY